MVKVSELLGKPVIALYSAETLGVAADIVFDSKLAVARAIKVLNSDNDNEPEVGFIELKHVKDVSLDALAIGGRHLLKYEWGIFASGTKNPINAVCYNQDGKLLGKVRDVSLEKLKVHEFMLDNLSFAPNKLLKHSADNLIFNDTAKPVRIAAPKKSSVPKVESGTQSVKVHMGRIEATQPSVGADVLGRPIATTPTDASPRQNATLTKLRDIVPLPHTRDIPFPTRVSQEKTQVSRSPIGSNALNDTYAFLLGKTLSRPLKDDSGKILARQNSIVEDATITIAKANSKLVQLALYAE